MVRTPEILAVVGFKLRLSRDINFNKDLPTPMSVYHMVLVMFLYSSRQRKYRVLLIYLPSSDIGSQASILSRTASMASHSYCRHSSASAVNFGALAFSARWAKQY
jgi:hypothetical protein